MKNVKQKYRVTYDSYADCVFTVHKPGKLLHFVIHKDGLHYHDTRNREITLVKTVQENEEGNRQRQIKDAKKAQYLYAKVGYPYARDFHQIISQYHPLSQDSSGLYFERSSGESILHMDIRP